MADDLPRQGWRRDLPTATWSPSPARATCAAHARATPPAPSASTRPALGAVFSGDTLFQGGPGATGRSFSDRAYILASIRDRLLTLHDDTVVHTGHGDDTTIGAERAGVAAALHELPA